MIPKVFVTGATGYIGGDALHVLYNAHPEYSYSALVRSSTKGAPVAAAYPSVRLVYGDLDNSALLEEEASKADIVLHTADSSDHEIAARAIAKGMAAGHTKTNPGFWLHTSGTGILMWKDEDAKRYGEAPQKGESYDDWEGVERLTSLPDGAFHRNVDKVVLEAGTRHADSVKTTIVCPPTIYGIGRGPVSNRSKQVPTLIKHSLERKKAIQLGAGKTEWNNVHIKDLSQLYLLLVEAAVAKNLDPELWGPKGYILAENGMHVWGQLAKQVAVAAHKAGYLPTDEPETLSPNAASEIAGLQALTWGLNSRGTALRARKVLGWTPKEPSLELCIPDAVEVEAKRAGISKGHAAKFA
ncbi:MAG: hypothetical protein M1818_001818 [Claussenomyces sp. TS43310]|nr:MAG: hypothetical protein M1818_001818 [Claussenomyces sp. TS43310]